MKLRDLLQRLSLHHQVQARADRLTRAIEKNAVVVCNYPGCKQRFESYLNLHRHQKREH